MDSACMRDVLGLILCEPMLPRQDIASASQVCRLWRDVTAALREVHRRDHLWWKMRSVVIKRVIIMGDMFSECNAHGIMYDSRVHDVMLAQEHIERARGVQYPLQNLSHVGLLEDVMRILNANLDTMGYDMQAPHFPHECSVSVHVERKVKSYDFVLTPDGMAPIRSDFSKYGPRIPRVNGIPEMIMFPNMPLRWHSAGHYGLVFPYILFQGEVRELINRKCLAAIIKDSPEQPGGNLISVSIRWRGRDMVMVLFDEELAQAIKCTHGAAALRCFDF